MFKLFKKPPEIPEEVDYLADSPEDALTLPESSIKDIPSQEVPSGVSAKREAKASSRHGWPFLLLGSILFIAIAGASYWILKVYNAPVPAEIPQGDILSSLSAIPSAAPPAPGNSSTQQNPAPKNSSPASTPQTPPLAENNPPAVPSMPPQTASPQTIPQNPIPSAPPVAKPEVKPETMPEDNQEVSQEVLSGIFGANPFIDLSMLHGYVTASSGSMDLPHFGGNGNMALPNVPRPDVSPDLLPSPGEIRTPAGPVGSAASAPPTMGGIIKASDGSAIAIMGDGTVLSEGDSYKGDRRVTFIGGEGIQFDDGDSIAFAGQNK